MAKIFFDETKIIGKIKPIHGVGQPPLLGADNFMMFPYLTDAGIPFSRLHDVGGVYAQGRFVDVPNIFRNFDADETDPASYDFAFTDVLIKGLMDAGVAPFFRLGVTIENDLYIKAYRIFPPKDPQKWAKICEHIIRHYNEGWADGFFYGIEYWEIWNEPDDTADIRYNPMWQGTKEDFLELYGITATHLKKCFPNIKVGGYGCCGFYKVADGLCSATDHEIDTQYFLDFFDDFLAYARKNRVPLDFFSWHSYDESVENNVIYANYARKKLDEYGFTDTESICDEWNIEYEKRGTLRHASITAAMLLAFQNSPLDSSMFYDARCGAGIYGSMFHCLERVPYPTYYAFAAFNRLYKLGKEIKTKTDDNALYTVGASDGKWACLVIANPTNEKKPLELPSGREPHRFVVTDKLGSDRECYTLRALPPESIVSVYFDLR